MKLALGLGALVVVFVGVGCLGRTSVEGGGAQDDAGPGYWDDSGPSPFPYGQDSGPDPYLVDGGPDPYLDGGPDPYPIDGSPVLWDDGGPFQVDGGPRVTDAGPRPDACALHAYYADADGDGFGDPTVATLACAQPAGYVANAQDCYDGNASAFPGQAAFFTADRGDGSFDYDCNGKDDQELSKLDPKICVCGIAGAVGCSVSSGYRDAIPACGDAGDFAVGGNGNTCDATILSVTEPCH